MNMKPFTFVWTVGERLKMWKIITVMFATQTVVNKETVY